MKGAMCVLFLRLSDKIISFPALLIPLWMVFKYIMQSYKYNKEIWLIFPEFI